MANLRLSDAVEVIQEKLYTIHQQLRLLSQFSVHERGSSVTIQSERFSVAMNHIAEQVMAVAEEIERLPFCKEESCAE